MNDGTINFSTTAALVCGPDRVLDTKIQTILRTRRQD